jgi:hypothetical protein
MGIRIARQLIPGLLLTYLLFFAASIKIQIGAVITNKKNPSLWGLRVKVGGDILIKDANGNEKTIASGGVIPIVKGLKIKFNETTIGEIR